MTDLPAPPPAAASTPNATRALMLRLFRTYLAPRWKGLSVALIAAALVALSSVTLVGLLEPATNGIFGQESARNLWLVPLQIVAVALLRAGAQAVQATLTNRIGHGIVGDIQLALFSRLLRADLAHLNASHTGAFVSPVLYDANLMREATTTGVINYVQQLLTVIVIVGLMFSLDGTLTLLVLVVAPLSSTLIRRFAKRTRKAAKGAMHETSALSTAMMEGLDGIKIVKINNREDDETRRVAEVIDRRQRHIIKGANARALSAPATEALMMVVTAGVLAYAAWRATNGGMNGGEFTTFMVALATASQSLRQLANLQPVMAEGLTAASRLFAALDVEPEVRDRPGAAPVVLTEATLRFEDVAFAYDDGTRAVKGVSLEVCRGERVALVGPSGGGKSTILNLIPRFYDVCAGRVTVDGQDVREVTLASLRDQIALVTQEPFLFDDTIRANIGYGRPGATEAEIEAAARAAAAHDFITELQGGYDAQVGEAGARLSGGQRQRIAIARAFLKDAPILLLDEPTSALDTESESQVQAALDRLMAGRTTLIIAHRLTTVRDCDRIYVINRGEVIEAGGHAQLLSLDGFYARMARAQNLDAVDAS
jgi:subfamily B ATP-binding cassette protein MsbA